MPSVFFFKDSSKGSVQVDSDSPGNTDNGTFEKERRTRDYFRSLIRRISVKSEVKPKRESRGGQFLKRTSPHQALSTPSPTSTPTSLRSTTVISDPNKPLPRRPPPDRPEAEPPPKPTMKLERIMTPIAREDLHKMFSGAPQFFARYENQASGTPYPSVAFPWNTELEVRELLDHVKVQDQAWECVTAWPHSTFQTSNKPRSAGKEHKEKYARYIPQCRERPNMLSMQGIERGTIGYAAALEIGVADALREPETVSNESPQTISDLRRDFLYKTNREGLRPLTDSALIDRLVSISETYHEESFRSRPTVELYTELFTQVLHPPSKVTDMNNPYSLQVQIEALVSVLSTPLIWFDFSLVEWRIRLGQILWGISSESDAADAIAINNEILHEPSTQKYWLLLQVLLSCELLLRLDAIAWNIEHGLEDTASDEMQRFDEEAHTSLGWSLILARQWFENIRLVKNDSGPKSQAKSSAGWLASLTRSGNETETKLNQINEMEALKLEGRNQDCQVSGLLHFARKLRWPHVDELANKVSSNGITMTDSIQSTPMLGTPLSVSTQRSSSYFSYRRPMLQRGRSTPRSISALIHPAGWLSNSYLSGLILPGESISHFLMSTLLEHDILAVSRLGDEANLYGGFVYGGRSFWSTACILGRVLAAGKWASECMGWISSDCLPQGVGEGWVDIEVEQRDLDKKKRPRILRKTSIESDGNVIGGADTSSVLPGDFVIPSDGSRRKPLTVTFESLNLFAIAEEDSTPYTDITEPPTVLTYTAMMKFAYQNVGEAQRSIGFNINHDVQFVAAHPCIPSSHIEILMSPTSPLMSPTSPSFHTASESPAVTPKLSGPPGFSAAPNSHPLYKGFTYSRVSIYQVLSKPSSTSLNELLKLPQSSDPTLSSTHTTSSTIKRVLVIDCTDTTSTSQRNLSPVYPGHNYSHGNDLEMMARALCADRGWNALVSRRGRGCLSCAVREASALGWRVILRLA